jgi:hypothetical protein
MDALFSESSAAVKAFSRVSGGPQAGLDGGGALGHPGSSDEGRLCARMRIVTPRGHVAGSTCWPIAQRKAAISRAIAAMVTGNFLPAALSRR